MSYAALSNKDQVIGLLLNFAFGPFLLFGCALRFIHWVFVFLGRLSGTFFSFSLAAATTAVQLRCRTKGKRVVLETELLFSVTI